MEKHPSLVEGLELVSYANADLDDTSSSSQKPAVLLLHGGFHNAECWDTTAQALASRGHRVYTMSLRGHGASSGHKNIQFATLSHFVSDVHQIVKHLNEPVVLVGHSAGGGVAQKYTEEHGGEEGHRVLGLVLVGSFPPAYAFGILLRWFVMAPVTFIWGLLTNDLFKLLSTVKLYKLSMFTSETSDHTVEEQLTKLDRNESILLPLTMSFTRYVEPRKVLAHGTRVFVFGGARDRLMTPSTVLATAKAYNVQAKILANSAHNMMLDANAGEFVDELDKVLQSTW